MTGPHLSDRSRRVLAALVREYVETGQPVASLGLARRGGFKVSSATIRNILVNLEELGYVRQPHTSAGRVPTDLGYRRYVDMLLESHRLSRPAPGVEAQLRQQAHKPALMHEVLSSVSHVVSSASHHLGFAAALVTPTAAFHRIDFVPLPGSNVLVVVAAQGGEVTQKVVDIGERVEPADLQEAANYLNSKFAGLSLADVRAAVVERMNQERTLYDLLLSRALRLARSTFEELTPQPTLFVEGTASLVEESTERLGEVSLATLGGLLQMVEEKDRLARLLTEYIEGPGLTIVIGAEHRNPDLREFSLVASTYFDGWRTGTVGVIGPTRMRYSRAIAVVSSAADAVSRLLRETDWDPATRSN
jgi:heat-inducible transcriptional repressor